MLRALLIAVAAIVAAFLFLGGSGPLGDRENDTPKTFETPFGRVHTSSRDQSLLPSLLNRNDFDKSRTASIELVWPQGSMGASYDERLRSIRARAESLSAQECELLLRSIAAKCRVSSTTPDVWDRSVVLRMNLQFVPKRAIGTIPKAADLQLDEFDLEYPDFNRAGVQDSDEAISDRAAIYAQIAKDCRETADIYGNCLLYRIRIDSDLLGPRGNHIIRTAGRASVAILRPQTFSR